MAKVLLINPSYNPSYGGVKASIVNPIMPTLGLATIAATALQKNHKVEILDLSWRPYDFDLVKNRILKSKPDIGEGFLNKPRSLYLAIGPSKAQNENNDRIGLFTTASCIN